jgi:hypothetical protein
MRAAIVALATLVVVVVIGLATATFRPSSDDAPLQPITVEGPAKVAPVPQAPPIARNLAPEQAPPLPEARTLLPPPPPPVRAGTNDVPPPPPPVVPDDLDDWAGDDDEGGFDDDD